MKRSLALPWVAHSALSFLGVALVMVFLLSRCGAGLKVTQCDLKSTWQTIDDFVPPASVSYATSTSVVVNSSNRVFHALTLTTAGQSAGYVRASDSSGLVWTNFDGFNYGNTPLGAEHFNLTIDPTERLWVQGRGWDSSSIPHWYIRRSADLGVSWTTVDDYTYTALGALPAFNGTGFIVGSTGSWFALGAGLSPSSDRLLVRKSDNQGSTWSVALDYQYSPGLSSQPRTMAKSSNGSLFLGGQGVDTAGTRRWLILKSTDNGTNWEVIDNFFLASGFQSQVKGLISLDENTVLATGWSQDASAEYHWITRRTTDGGVSWSTVDIVSVSSAASGDIVVDPRGYLYAPGSIGLGAESRPSIRRSTDGGSRWTTADQLVLTSPVATGDFRAIASGPDGAVYAVGEFTDSAGALHVVTRKLPCR